MPFGGLLAAAGVGAAGAFFSGQGNRQNTSVEQLARLEEVSRRGRAQSALEKFALTLEQGGTLSPQEQQLFNAIARERESGINLAVTEGVKQGLDVQAGTGFLRSGRQAGQTRRLITEGERLRTQALLEAETNKRNLINQRFEQKLNATSQLANLTPITPQDMRPRSLTGAQKFGLALSSGAGIFAGGLSGGGGG